MSIGIAVLVLYAVAFGCLLLSFRRAFMQPIFYAALLAAWGFHLFLLYQYIDTPTGQNLNVFNMLSLTAALWVGTLCLVNVKVALKSLFVAILPLAGLSVFGAMSVQAPGVPMPLGDQPLAVWHILTALASYALLGVAFLQALALALQRRYLSMAPASDFLRYLPPLETMQRVMMSVLMIALLTLTLSLFFGFWAHPHSPLLSFKNVISLSVWGLCSVLCVVDYRYGLTARVAIVGTGIAWVGLSLAYIGMKLFSGAL